MLGWLDARQRRPPCGGCEVPPCCYQREVRLSAVVARPSQVRGIAVLSGFARSGVHVGPCLARRRARGTALTPGLSMCQSFCGTFCPAASASRCGRWVVSTSPPRGHWPPSPWSTAGTAPGVGISALLCLDAGTRWRLGGRWRPWRLRTGRWYPRGPSTPTQRPTGRDSSILRWLQRGAATSSPLRPRLRPRACTAASPRWTHRLGAPCSTSAAGAAGATRSPSTAGTRCGWWTFRCPGPRRAATRLPRRQTSSPSSASPAAATRQRPRAQPPHFSTSRCAPPHGAVR